MRLLAQLPQTVKLVHISRSQVGASANAVSLPAAVGLPAGAAAKSKRPATGKGGAARNGVSLRVHLLTAMHQQMRGSGLRRPSERKPKKVCIQCPASGSTLTQHAHVRFCSFQESQRPSVPSWGSGQTGSRRIPIGASARRCTNNYTTLNVLVWCSGSVFSRHGPRASDAIADHNAFNEMAKTEASSTPGGNSFRTCAFHP